MTLALRYAARSDVGLVRDGNEDSVYAGPRLLAVADGMGGHAAGEVASTIAIAALAPLDEDAPGGDLLDALRDAVDDANDQLRDAGRRATRARGHGHDAHRAALRRHRIGLLHVGDSRAYLLRGGELTQITHDHTYVQSLVDAGRITRERGRQPPAAVAAPARARRAPRTSSPTCRSARPRRRPLPALQRRPVRRRVSDDDPARGAAPCPDPGTAVDRLVELALRGGGPDNITCIVADVVDDSRSRRASRRRRWSPAQRPSTRPARCQGLTHRQRGRPWSPAR